MYTPRQTPPWAEPPPPTPRQTATAVDGTHLVKQECIPVGCLLSAVVAICWGRGSAEGVSARGCLPRGVSARKGVCPGGVSARPLLPCEQDGKNGFNEVL